MSEPLLPEGPCSKHNAPMKNLHDRCRTCLSKSLVKCLFRTKAEYSRIHIEARYFE